MLKGRIEPRPQVSIRQQIEAEQGREVRETPGPGGLEPEIFQQHHGNQRNPDLDLHGVLTGADKRLDLEVLLQSFEEEFDLPALLIDGGNRTGGQMHEVRQEGEPSLLRLVPDGHLPQRDGTAACRPVRRITSSATIGPRMGTGRRSRTSCSMFVRGRVTNPTSASVQR